MKFTPTRCTGRHPLPAFLISVSRLISGASPLRGLSNIGANIHGLLMIPVQEYKKKGAAGVLRALQRQSVSLFKTITRETLHASHKVATHLPPPLNCS